MKNIEKPTVVTEFESENGSFGRFVVEPLERGYGTTLGNSLRRVLLRIMEGPLFLFRTASFVPKISPR